MTVQVRCPICTIDEGSIYPVLHAEEMDSRALDHLFHEHCLLNWAKISETCPTCRMKITHINGKLIHQHQVDEPIAFKIIQIDGDCDIDHLFYAIEKGSADEVQTLLNMAIYISSKNLKEALILAASNGNRAIMNCLISYIDIDEEIYSRSLLEAFADVLENGHEDAARYMLLYRPNSRPALVDRALTISARNNLIPFAKDLLSMNLHTNDLLLNGIDIAKSYNNAEMADLLRDHLIPFCNGFEKLMSCSIQ